MRADFADLRNFRHRFKNAKSTTWYRNFNGPDDQSPKDHRKDFHGTNCVSTLLHVAPRTRVYAANVVDPNTGDPTPKMVAEAMEWAIA